MKVFLVGSSLVIAGALSLFCCGRATTTNGNSSSGSQVSLALNPQPTPILFDDGDPTDVAAGACAAAPAPGSLVDAGSPFAPPGPDCTAAGIAARLAQEKALAAQMIAAGCLPNNFGAQPCAGLYAQWKALKETNATCNSAKQGCGLCAYYTGLVAKYTNILNTVCKPPITVQVPPQMAPLTPQQYCDYVAAGLTLAQAEAKALCP